MARRVLAEALILLGGVIAGLGLSGALSIALCSPPSGLASTSAGGCVPASLIVWYGLALVIAVPIAGFALVGVGAVLYRRAGAV